MNSLTFACPRGLLHASQLGPAHGRPLLCLHHGGAGFAQEPWAPPFPQLAVAERPWRILRLDRRGYGFSSQRPEGFPPGFFEHDLEDLRTVLDLWEPRRPVVIQGTSDGGSLALLAAARWPERIAAVAVDGAHHRTEDSMRDALVDMQTRFLEKHGPPRADEAMESHTLRSWFAGWLEIVRLGWSMEGELAAIRCPVAVLQGQLDGIVDEAHAHSLASSLGRPAVARILPGGAHLCQRSHPEAWAAWLQDFLDSLPDPVVAP